MTEQAKHTPGPWSVDEEINHLRRVNSDLLAALESVPMPHVCGWRDRCEVDSKRPLCDHCEYRFWYEGPRVAALAKAKVKP